MATNNSVDVPLAGNTGTGNFVGANTPILITPNIGVATATSLVFNPTTNGIIGTTTNDNTVTGDVGEFVNSVIAQASAITLTTVTPANVTSISLTAGDWDVWGNVFFFNATYSNIQAWTSSTSATPPDNSIVASIAITGLSGGGMNIPVQRYSLAGTTTVYLSCNQSVTSGTGKACGGIYARRRR